MLGWSLTFFIIAVLAGIFLGIRKPFEPGHLIQTKGHLKGIRPARCFLSS